MMMVGSNRYTHVLVGFTLFIIAHFIDQIIIYTILSRVCIYVYFVKMSI